MTEEKQQRYYSRNARGETSYFLETLEDGILKTSNPIGSHQILSALNATLNASTNGVTITERRIDQIIELLHKYHECCSNDEEDASEAVELICYLTRTKLTNHQEQNNDTGRPEETMVLCFDPVNGCLWHSDCEKSSSGIIVKTEHEKDRTLMTCGHCNKQGYYPVGGAGRIRVPVISTLQQALGEQNNE